MPHERTRALIRTRELLEELRMRDDLPGDLKQRVLHCLRHYPSVDQIRGIGYMMPRGGLGNEFAAHEDYDHAKAIEESLKTKPTPTEL